MEQDTNQVVADRYELRDVIGRGGQALVFRARDRKQDRWVAVKVMSSTLSEDPEWIERMTREQQAMVALAGTNAVGFIDLCVSDRGATCLVMELLRGLNLEEYLKRREERGRRMEASDLVDLMAPVVDTLDKAHGAGIVHRDLKPGNLFVVTEATGERLRLLDFGFARLKTSTQVTQEGMVMGSPSYIAPEMWRSNTQKVDRRADVYSLGVTLFRMLAGQVPLAGDSLQQQFIITTSAERPSLHALRPDLPAKVDIWVERALAIDPEDRFPTVRACWNELLWALEPGDARRPVHAEHARKPQRRRASAWWATMTESASRTQAAVGRAARALIERLRTVPSPIEKVAAPSQRASPPPAEPPGTLPPIPDVASFPIGADQQPATTASSEDEKVAATDGDDAPTLLYVQPEAAEDTSRDSK